MSSKTDTGAPHGDCASAN